MFALFLFRNECYLPLLFSKIKIYVIDPDCIFFLSYFFRGSRGGWRGNYQNPNSYGQQRPDSASNDGRGSSYGGSRNWEVGIKIVGSNHFIFGQSESLYSL